MGILDSLKRPKSLSELEEENELLDSQYQGEQTKTAIAQEQLRRKIATKRLKESGLTPKHFNYNWKSIYNWFDKMGGGKGGK